MKKETTHGIFTVLILIAVVAGLVFGFGEDSVVGNRRVITAVGLSGDSHRYHVSVQAVEALKTAGNLSEQEDTATAVYTASGETVATAFHNFLTTSGNRAYVLQNQLLIISEDLCRHRSLFTILDYFMRNAESNPTIKVAVFRGNPADLLALPSGSEAIPAAAVAQLIDEGFKGGICLNTSLLDIERAFSGMSDAALPLIVWQNDTPRLCGTALFRDGNWAGELDEAQTVGLLAARNRLQNAVWQINGVALRLESSKTTVHLQEDRYVFSLSGKVKLVEKTVALTAKQRQDCLKTAETVLKNQVTAALHTTDNAQSDVLGLKRRANKRYPNQAIAAVFDWEKQVNVTLKFADSGFFKQ